MNDNSGLTPSFLWTILGTLLVTLGFVGLFFGDVNTGEPLIQKLVAIGMGTLIVILAQTVFKNFHKK